LIIADKKLGLQVTTLHIGNTIMKSLSALQFIQNPTITTGANKTLETATV